MLQQNFCEFRNPSLGSVVDFSKHDAAEIAKWKTLGIEAVSQGKLGIVLDFSGVHQSHKGENCKALIDSLFPVKMSYLEYMLRKIKSVGDQCTKKSTKINDTGRDPIMVFVQTNELFSKAIIDALVENSYFGYRGIIVCQTVSIQSCI